jgi:hypothetical protein
LYNPPLLTRTQRQQRALEEAAGRAPKPFINGEYYRNNNNNNSNSSSSSSRASGAALRASFAALAGGIANEEQVLASLTERPPSPSDFNRSKALSLSVMVRSAASVTSFQPNETSVIINPNGGDDDSKTKKRRLTLAERLALERGEKLPDPEPPEPQPTPIVPPSKASRTLSIALDPTPSSSSLSTTTSATTKRAPSSTSSSSLSSSISSSSRSNNNSVTTVPRTVSSNHHITSSLSSTPTPTLPSPPPTLSSSSTRGETKKKKPEKPELQAFLTSVKSVFTRDETVEFQSILRQLIECKQKEKAAAKANGGVLPTPPTPPADDPMMMNLLSRLHPLFMSTERAQLRHDFETFLPQRYRAPYRAAITSSSSSTLSPSSSSSISLSSSSSATTTVPSPSTTPIGQSAAVDPSTVGMTAEEIKAKRTAAQAEWVASVRGILSSEQYKEFKEAVFQVRKLQTGLPPVSSILSIHPFAFCSFG